MCHRGAFYMPSRPLALSSINKLVTLDDERGSSAHCRLIYEPAFEECLCNQHSRFLMPGEKDQTFSSVYKPPVRWPQSRPLRCPPSEWVLTRLITGSKDAEQNRYHRTAALILHRDHRHYHQNECRSLPDVWSRTRIIPNGIKYCKISPI